MNEILAQVSTLRGLEAGEIQETEVMDQTELEKYLVDKLEREYTQEEEFQELVTLSYLGLIPPDFNIRDFALNMYQEQLLGFYEAEQNQMFLLQEATFDPLERMTYAHEVVHALSDQKFDLDGKLGFSDAGCDPEGEYCAALRALMEGDASLASAMWMMANTTPEEQSEINAASQKQSPVLVNAPAVYQEDLSFPYTVGTPFVNYLYQQGGWPAVDQAYLEPPLSTEQIMHPERYPDDQPMKVSLPDLSPALGDGWELLDQDTLGEWHTLLVLTSGVDPQARQDVATALPAVTGWGGDVYQVYFNSGAQQVVLVLMTKWDTSADAEEFYTALGQHVMARFDLADSEGDLIEMFQAMQLGHAQFQLDDDTTYYVLSPAEEISLAILKAAFEK
ncbi:MAG: hypothetical protein MUE67_11915 [Anaerolineales bacterium]|nr:hypothetical protein [Anaerolineales bacterium]